MNILKSKVFVVGSAFALVTTFGTAWAIRAPLLPMVVIVLGVIGLNSVHLMVGLRTAAAIRRSERNVLHQFDRLSSSLLSNANGIAGVGRKVTDLAPAIRGVRNEVQALTVSMSSSTRKISDVETALLGLEVQLELLVDVDRRTRVSYGRIFEAQQQLHVIKGQLLALEESLRNHKADLGPLVSAGPFMAVIHESTLAMGDQLGRGFTNVVSALDSLSADVQGCSERSGAARQDGSALDSEAQGAVDQKPIEPLMEAPYEASS